MKSMMKDAMILFAITLISGLLLGVVYEVTKEPIAVSQASRKKEAFQEVFQDASGFEALELSLSEMEEKASATINVVSRAVAEDGKLLGYVFDITTHEGYNGDIQFTMGIRLDGTVNGISLLSIAETPGLGMKAEEVLKPQFAGKKVTRFLYTKTGAVTEEEVDAISGATVTTNALVNGLNAGLEVFKNQLGGAVNE